MFVTDLKDMKFLYNIHPQIRHIFLNKTTLRIITHSLSVTTMNTTTVPRTERLRIIHLTE